jgi:hypothetical protein
VAGHVGLEIRNVVAKYPFERSHRFPGIQPNSGHRDHSRLNCGGGGAARASCQDLGRMLALTEIAAIFCRCRDDPAAASLHPQRVEKTFDVLAAARCRCRNWAGPTFCFVRSFRPATNRGARAWLPLAAAHSPTNQWRTGQNSRPAGHSRKSAASAWTGATTALSSIAASLVNLFYAQRLFVESSGHRTSCALQLSKLLDVTKFGVAIDFASRRVSYRRISTGAAKIINVAASPKKTAAGEAKSANASPKE